MSFRNLLPALLLATVASAAADDAATSLQSGIDASAMDKSVRPQDDLFRHVNGTWLETTEFPAEYPSAGIGIMLFEKAQADVQAILLEDKGQLNDMYMSFMDEARVEAQGAGSTVEADWARRRCTTSRRSDA
jgi:predicted metalloendopeptidase